MPFIMIRGGNMNDILPIIFGVAIASVAINTFQDFSENSERNIIRKAVENCQKSLPRDQQCYIIAVPVSKD